MNLIECKLIRTYNKWILYICNHKSIIGQLLSTTISLSIYFLLRLSAWVQFIFSYIKLVYAALLQMTFKKGQNILALLFFYRKGDSSFYANCLRKGKRRKFDMSTIKRYFACDSFRKWNIRLIRWKNVCRREVEFQFRSHIYEDEGWFIQINMSWLEQIS